jgi:hypothetical protein
MTTDSGVFRSTGFVIPAWVQAGRECQCRDLFEGGGAEGIRKTIFP